VSEKRRSLRALLLLLRPPRLARVLFRESSSKLISVEGNFFLLGAPIELGTCRACVCMLAACPYLLRVAVRLEAPLLGYTRRLARSRASASLLSLLRSSFYSRCSLVLPIPATACIAVRESRPPKPCLLRSWTGRRAIRFLGSVSARPLASVQVLPRRYVSSSSGSTTSTRHHGRQPWWICCCGSDLPGRPYVLLISYLALVLVPFAYLLDVLACLHVVKLTSAYLLLTSVIQLTQKFPNILTIQKPYMIRKFSLAGLLLLSNRACLWVLISRDGRIRPCCGSLLWACRELRKVLP
jgi:hypothetical protein